MQKQNPKERIRGPKLKVLIKKENGLPFAEGLMKANKKNRVIASNKRMDKAVVGSSEWKEIESALSCWTGTMTGYEEKNKELEKEIVYIDPRTEQRYVFPTGNAKGSKNVILVAEHPNYTLEKDGKDLRVIVKESMVDILERFPVSGGWYKTDEKHGIPTGRQVNSDNKDARYLARTDGARVGPVARTDGILGCLDKCAVELHGRPSSGYGVVVEAPELKITEKSGKLIIEGTPGQVAEAKRMLEKLKQ